MKRNIAIFMLLIAALVVTVIPSLAQDSASKEYGNWGRLEAAEQGDLAAQVYLGSMFYLYGDYEQSAKWLTKAAEQGDVDSMYNLGFFYLDGIGVEEDDEQALKWFKMAAEQGEPDSAYAVGLCYYNGEGTDRDYVQALEWFTKAAENENPYACYYLGSMYEFGDGVDPDYEKAADFYRRAGLQGMSEAQYRMGLFLEKGYGVEQDYSQALAWYHSAAWNGYEDAIRKLDVYEEMINILSGSVDDYLQAAEAGDAEAQYKLGYVYYYGLRVDQDFEQAAEWFAKAAAQGYESPEFLYLYSLLFANGYGVEEDSDNAMKLLKKAADLGQAEAQYDLYVKYTYGIGVSPDMKEAQKYLEMAADQEYIPALYKLGETANMAGEYEKAVEWFEKAARQGDASAQYALGMMYMGGNGVEKDTQTAYYWLSEAADQGHSNARLILGR